MSETISNINRPPQVEIEAGTNQVTGFDELRRWAIFNHPLWRASELHAEAVKLEPIATLQLIAGRLLVENANMRQQLINHEKWSWPV